LSGYPKSFVERGWGGVLVVVLLIDQGTFNGDVVDFGYFLVCILCTDRLGNQWEQPLFIKNYYAAVEEVLRVISIEVAHRHRTAQF